MMFEICVDSGLLCEKSLSKKKDFEARKVASIFGVPDPPRLEGRYLWHPRVYALPFLTKASSFFLRFSKYSFDG